jgi:hypothetical protein
MSWREWLGFKPTMRDLALHLLKNFHEEGKPQWKFNSEKSTLEDESGSVINLTNMYLEYSQSPRSTRPQLLQKYSSIAQVLGTEVPKLWELGAKKIYAVVRSRYDTCVNSILGRLEQTSPVTVSWPWIGDLIVRVVYDHGDQVTHLNEEYLDIWGQTGERVRERAIQNLRALPAPAWENLGDGVYQLMSEESYNESFLLVDKVIDRLPFRDSAVCVPCNRGILLAADRNSTECLKAMIDRAFENLRSKPWPLSATLLARQGAEWFEYQPTSEIVSRVEDLHRINIGITYADQKTALEEIHEKTGKDIFVATFGLWRREADGNAIRSWCSWAAGVHSLLPKTDQIAFGKDPSNKESQPVLLNWDSAVALCGRHMTPTAEDPPRFEARTFPDDSEWAEIVAASRVEN